MRPVVFNLTCWAFGVWIALGAVAVHAERASLEALPDESPAMRAVLDRLLAELDRVEAATPALVEAAEYAAAAIVDSEDALLTVTGDNALRYEMTHRPGAWQAMTLLPPREHDVTLTAEGETLRVYVPTDADHQDDGGTEPHTFTLITNADSPTRTAAAWAFQLELFAALTRAQRTDRRGVTRPGPVIVIRQCEDLDRKQDRYYRYGGDRFHRDRWLDPVAPGSLTHDYLNALRGDLRDLGTTSYRSIVRTAERAAATRADGGTVYLHPGATGGARLLQHRLAAGGFACFDPVTTDALQQRLNDPEADRHTAESGAPGPGDFVIAAGYREWPGSDLWGRFTVPVLRDAGRGVAWVINPNNTRRSDYRRTSRWQQTRFSPGGEWLLDLQGPPGDCVVTVEHYDARLGPVSGVLSECVVMMIDAHLLALQE